MGEFPILLTAAGIVATLLLAPRLRNVFRSDARGARGNILHRFHRIFRGISRNDDTHRRGIDVQADLLRACGGDRATMERLIRHEISRKPELGRMGAALMALSRLRADRR